MAALRFPPFLGYVFQRRARDLQDHAVARELRLAEQDLGWPSGLSLRWLGTSGFALRYQGYQLLIDPYLTRISMGDFLRRRVVQSSVERVHQFIDAADAVLIGHTHFDHALDAPLIAKSFDCKVYGSASTQKLMLLHGLGASSVLVEHYRRYELGPFEVSFVPSVHAKLQLGLSVPYSGDVCCEHLDELTPSAYRCGQVYGIHIRVGGMSLYHQGSADLIDDAIREKGVDVFLAGIAGRGFTRDYARRVLHALQPRIVIPTHYDNFFEPLDGPMKLSTNINLTGFVEEVAAVSKEFQVGTLEPLETLGSR